MDTSSDPNDWLAAVIPLLGVHVYAAEFRADGSYHVPHVGPNSELMLGGFPAGGLTAATWDERVHPDDRAEYDRAFSYDQMLLGLPVQSEYRLVGFDGVTRWVLDRCVPRMPTENGVLVLEGVVIDVSEHRALVDDLAEARATIERIAESIDEVFYTYELLGSGGWRWHFTTPGVARLIGRGDHDDASSGFDEAMWDASVHPDDRKIYAGAIADVARGKATDIEFRILGAAGQARWLRARDRPRSTGGPALVDGVLADVTDRKLAEIALEEARADAEERSRTDALTGLDNRRHFGDVLATELLRARREGTTPALLLVDLDEFKRVNDLYGHGAGDDVLIGVGARIRAALRAYDVVARFGGEEFVILAPSVPDAAVISKIGEEVCRAIGERPYATRAGDLTVTASVGAVRATPDLRGSDALLDAADRAMYCAKHRGGNGVSLFADLELPVRKLTA